MNRFYDCRSIIEVEIIGRKLFRKKESCFKIYTFFGKKLTACDEEDATIKFKNCIDGAISNIDTKIDLKKWRSTFYDKFFDKFSFTDKIIYDFLKNYTFVNKSITVSIKNAKLSDIVIDELNFKDTIESFTAAEIFEE